ncbi:MAG TPA: PAS domain S-box protein [Syntrophales bacterium]|nr:PAS domain S-box protein [Syntrophales bacterium]
MADQTNTRNIPLHLVIIFFLLAAGIGMSGYVLYKTTISESFRMALVLVCSLIVTAGMAMALVWRHQRSRLYRKLYEAELTRDVIAKHFEYLTRYANDIILLLDAGWNIIEANDRAAQSYGYTREEMLGMNVRTIRDPEAMPDLGGLIEKVDRMNGMVYETKHISKDGTKFPVEISARVIEIEGKKFFQAIIRNIAERKQAEEALKESEMNFRRIFDQSPVGAAITSPDYHFTGVNEAMCRMLGYSAEEFALLRFTDITHPDHLGADTEQVKLLASGEIDRYVTEKRYIRKDGEIIWGQLSVRAIRDTAGSLLYFLPMIVDITERKRAEEALQESEKKYREFVNFLPIAVFELDTEGNIISVNDAFLEMFSYTKADIDAGLKALERLTPEDRERAGNRLQRVLKGEATGGNEYTAVRKDGSTLHVLIFTNPVSRNGRVVGAGGAIIDISRRRRAEELYRTLADSSQIGVYVALEGKLKFVNPLISEYTGYTENSLIDKSVLDFIHPEDRDMARANAMDMLKGRRSIPYEFRITDFHGRTRWLMETVRSVTYEGKQAILGNVVDLTERHHMERMLRQAQKMEAIGTLAGGIAHDFNNILTAIIGYSEMALYKGRGDNAIRRDLEQVLKAGARARDLVSQILTFSRQTEHERKPVQIAPIVKEALKLLRSSLPATIEMHQNIAITPDRGIILADPTQVQQILMNLCTNAAHAMRETGGILGVRLSEVDVDASFTSRHTDMLPGRYVALTVSDTGHGMSTTVMERIFDPYFTTKEAGEGTGLGLSIVQGIVKGYGGGITVYSEPGKGSIVNIFLPTIEEAISSEAELMDELPTGDERILFIDDEKDLADLGKEMLQSIGYDVTTGTNSSEALETFRDKPHAFDLVITDMTMPGMTGLELARELRAIRPDVPIILSTGFSELINEKRVKELGVRELVMKPFTTIRLARIIRRILDAKKEGHN